MEEYYEDEEPGWEEAAFEVAREAGINVLSDKEVENVLFVGEEPAAALFTSTIQRVFSFDVAVKPKFQGRGLGSKLVDEALGIFSLLDGDFTLEVDAINPVMVKMLEGRGLTVQDTFEDHNMMRLSNAFCIIHLQLP